MGNILKVTSPNVGFDNNSNVMRNNQTSYVPQGIEGQVAPDKVVRPDARSDAASDQADAALKFRYDNNFESFVQQIIKNPPIAEKYTSVFLEKLAVMVESGMNTGIAGEISKFLNMINISGAELLGFLKMQGQSSVKFHGDFFNLLRHIFNSTVSVDAKTNILDFLKKYTDMTEGTHILDNIRQTIEEAKGRMFTGGREAIAEMEQGLNYYAQNGDVKNNSDIIKNKILPYLNEYIMKMHDRGQLRESAAYLSLLVARYENGDVNKMQEAFFRLMALPEMKDIFGNIDTAALLRVLASTEFEKASEKNKVMDSLAEMIRRGVMGEAGVENRGFFVDLMNSMILNESVYMPLLHMMLPLNVGGTLMFSEIWVDPDSREKNEKTGEHERCVRCLLKFDIQNLGYFDLFMIYSAENNGTVSLQLHYPEKLVGAESAIRNGLAHILAANGLKSDEIILAAGERPISISEAFPKIYERKNSIDVSI